MENQAKVAETLEKLLERIESYQMEKKEDVNRASMVFDKLDKLVQTMSRLENQQNTEAVLASKIDEMTKHIDTIMKQQYKQEKQVEVEETVRRVLHGAKITGKVIETVATSANVMFGTITNLLKEEAKGGTSKKQAVDELDLGALLKPINSLIQGFAAVGASSNKSEDSSVEKDKVTYLKQETDSSPENK